MGQQYIKHGNATNNCECETLATTALPTEPGDLVLLTATHGGLTESADFQTRNNFIEMSIIILRHIAFIIRN